MDDDDRGAMRCGVDQVLYFLNEIALDQTGRAEGEEVDCRTQPGPAFLIHRRRTMSLELREPLVGICDPVLHSTSVDVRDSRFLADCDGHQPRSSATVQRRGNTAKPESHRREQASSDTKTLRVSEFRFLQFIDR